MYHSTRFQHAGKISQQATKQASKARKQAEKDLPARCAQMTKYEKMWVRTKSTVAMIGGFIFIIYMGHVPLMFLIFAIQVPDCDKTEERSLVT